MTVYVKMYWQNLIVEKGKFNTTRFISNTNLPSGAKSVLVLKCFSGGTMLLRFPVTPKVVANIAIFKKILKNYEIFDYIR